LFVTGARLIPFETIPEILPDVMLDKKPIRKPGSHPCLETCDRRTICTAVPEGWLPFLTEQL